MRYQDERNHAEVNVARGDAIWDNPSQVKERKPEGWRQKRRLQVDRNHDAQPDGVDTHSHQNGTNDRHHHESDLNEVENKTQ